MTLTRYVRVFFFCQVICSFAPKPKAHHVQVHDYEQTRGWDQVLSICCRPLSVFTHYSLTHCLPRLTEKLLSELQRILNLSFISIFFESKRALTFICIIKKYSIMFKIQCDGFIWDQLRVWVSPKFSTLVCKWANRLPYINMKYDFTITLAFRRLYNITSTYHQQFPPLNLKFLKE